MPNLVLLNPPGRDLYLRDYYCSKTSKADYLYHPVDLLVASGHLNPHFELHVIDAIADRLDAAATLRRIRELDPAGVLGLIGAVSIDEDLEFYRELGRDGLPILLTGDVVMEDTAEFIEIFPFVAGILLDFTSDESAAFLRGERRPFSAIACRLEDGSIHAPARPTKEQISIPLPRHELFRHPAYRYPFVRRHPFATVLTDYGCPYGCSFCIMAALPFRLRPVGEVIEELRYIRSLGIRDVYFDDQTFGVKPERTVELCEGIAREVPDLGWVAFTRADLLDPERLRLMQRAGCHTLMMGVESANQQLLDSTRKALDLAAVKRGFDLCREAGIHTVATFLFGLENETEDDIRATVDFARRLRCDYASFNVAVPRARTRFRRDWQSSGQWRDWQAMDQSGRREMADDRRGIDYTAAIRRANLRFYLRPGYLARRMLTLTSPQQLLMQLRFARGLFR